MPLFPQTCIRTGVFSSMGASKAEGRLLWLSGHHLPLFVRWTSPFPLIASTSSVSMSRVLPLRARPDSMGWEQTPASSPGARLCSFPGIVLVEVLKSKNKSTQERIKQIGIPKRTGYAHLVVLTLLLKPPLSAAW